MTDQRTSTGKELGKALVIATGVATLLTIFFPLHGFMERQAEQQAEIEKLRADQQTSIEKLRAERQAAIDAIRGDMASIQLDLAVLQTKVQAIQAWPVPASK